MSAQLIASNSRPRSLSLARALSLSLFLSLYPTKTIYKYRKNTVDSMML